MEQKINDVKECITKYRFRDIVPKVNAALDAGFTAGQILDEGMIAGMNEIGEGFKNNTIFMPQMLMAAKTMQAGLEVLRPKLAESDDSGVKGILISNGPGDPAHPEIAKTTVRTVSDLSTQLPMFGICFGSQLIGIAMGGSTYKLKFGHRGCNQPVKNGNRVYITSQNHGFAVDEHSLDGTGLIVNQVNVNDGSVEGVVHRDLPIFTSQYHPEASPGPCDTSYLFDWFGRMIKEGKL